MGFIITTEPNSEPVPLEAVKDHIRVEEAIEDPLITSYITVARQWVEKYTSRALIDQVITEYFEEWPRDGKFYLSRTPASVVTSVTYTDIDGAETTVSASDYIVPAAATPAVVQLKDAFSTPSAVLREVEPIKIVYTAGYGEAPSDVPIIFHHAIKLLVGDLYENRENTVIAQGVTVVEASFAVKNLLRLYKVWARK